jgi:hypothetical protein
VDQCLADADCPAGTMCGCRGELFSLGNQCIPTGCRTDADCAGGTCVPSFGGFCNRINGKYCNGASDACSPSGGCAAGDCRYAPETGKWACVLTHQCGG